MTDDVAELVERARVRASITLMANVLGPWPGRPKRMANEIAMARDTLALLAALPARDEELERLRKFVRLADALYVSASKHAQDLSDQKYKAEFGIEGPSLAGFLPGGADRDYHIARHRAGECPLPHHERFIAAALPSGPMQSVPLPDGSDPIAEGKVW